MGVVSVYTGDEEVHFEIDTFLTKEDIRKQCIVLLQSNNDGLFVDHFEFYPDSKKYFPGSSVILLPVIT